MKYYELIVDGYDKVGGMLYAPLEWPSPIAVDAMEVENWQNLTLELRDGKYLSCKLTYRHNYFADFCFKLLELSNCLYLLGF